MATEGLAAWRSDAAHYLPVTCSFSVRSCSRSLASSSIVLAGATVCWPAPNRDVAKRRDSATLSSLAMSTAIPEYAKARLSARCRSAHWDARQADEVKTGSNLNLARAVNTELRMTSLGRQKFALQYNGTLSLRVRGRCRRNNNSVFTQFSRCVGLDARMYLGRP